MAFFGRNASKTEEATPKTAHIRQFFPWQRSRFSFFKSNPITYQTGSERDGPVSGGRRLHDAEVFEAYLERLLAPALRPGQVVVMDNLSSHKGSRVGI
jgi:hypothetical protein